MIFCDSLLKWRKERELGRVCFFKRYFMMRKCRESTSRGYTCVYESAICELNFVIIENKPLKFVNYVFLTNSISLRKHEGQNGRFQGIYYNIFHWLMQKADPMKAVVTLVSDTFHFAGNVSKVMV